MSYILSMQVKSGPAWTAEEHEFDTKGAAEKAGTLALLSGRYSYYEVYHS